MGMFQFFFFDEGDGKLESKVHFLEMLMLLLNFFHRYDALHLFNILPVTLLNIFINKYTKQKLHEINNLQLDDTIRI